MSENAISVNDHKPKKMGAPLQDLGPKFAIQLYAKDWPLVEILSKERDRPLTRVIRDLVRESLARLSSK